jgi:hypothetical protein
MNDELVGHSFQSCPDLPMLEDRPSVSSCGNGEAERSPHPESMGSEENKKKGGLKIRISANGIGGGLCVTTVLNGEGKRVEGSD